MRILVCIPTRNRPALLITTLMAFDQLSTGQHEISYAIGIDEDDMAAYEAAKICAANIPRVSMHFVPKDVVTIGGIWNFLVRGQEADVYLAHVDDAIPLMRYWDELIARYVQAGHKAFSWFDSELGNQAGYPVITHDWLKASGYFQIDHFPFWFCDTWFEEVFQFTFNKKISIPPQLAVGGKRGTTTNLRDLDFWWGFFNTTRRIRLLEGYRLSKAMGCQVYAEYSDYLVSRKHWIDEATKRDQSFKGKRIAELEDARKEQKEPSARYLEAKRRAEAYMTERGAELWACVPKEPVVSEEQKLAAE